MADNKISVTINCKNIAPLSNLAYTITSSNMELGVFASNGSGKTFLSRMFRLAEGTQTLVADETGSCPIVDKLLSLGASSGSFEFRVVSKEGVSIENIHIDITRGHLPHLPTPYYLYHTFNQDYVEDNIKALGYEKDSDVEGYILGKAQIDLTEEESKLQGIKEKGGSLQKHLLSDISAFITANVDSIRDVKRLKEYSDYLNPNTMLSKSRREKVTLSKSFSEYVSDYDKVKAIPENLKDINNLGLIDIDREQWDAFLALLQQEFSASSFAEEFKRRMQENQPFYELGVELIKQEAGVRPSCRQPLAPQALEIVDEYVKFLSDEESKVLKRLNEILKEIDHQIKQLDAKERSNTEAKLLFDEYKSKYIPSCEKDEMSRLPLSNAIDLLNEFKRLLEQKSQNITQVITTDSSIVDDLVGCFKAINDTVLTNNQLINKINERKNRANEESREIRRNICLAAYNYLFDSYEKEIDQLWTLASEAQLLQADIDKKREKEKVSRKSKVFETIRNVLEYFFSGKYTLEENSFRLVFNKTTLEKNQANNVLSEGEKNIIAFAYYLGDTYTRINTDEDFKRLFFVIDDPISSMDFAHVYTVCGIMRDLQKILPEISGHQKLLVLTHNNDFIRMLHSNGIVKTTMLLKSSQLYPFNENFTVPYLSHLIDIYKIARCGSLHTHTTANSIRHIIETINQFEYVDANKNSVKVFIENNFPKDKTSYTYINDLSHGGWRTGQEPLTEDDYHEICESVIQMIEKKYPGQIEFCKDF